ncbi:hypothetical protein SAMN02745911_1643 [Aureimonas altamirensis DSM 21988]|uniref:Carbon monoxide dehydrogenase subunit G n=1 Tax=Aureimonas altamirensis DSM 21988 TaxID=1121026 RepID=A0ABY1IFA0_9HYPH|nr:carbon monoxide dehydrogenase subunit G [Aureimonas altamirensis]SHJ08952.1 hypothetical protein SAMN02745911_1643 [Aureimonas altamirensis DSM 21988]
MMKIEGEVWLPLERQRVWQGLNDPDVLKDCIHACEHLQWVGPDLLEATVAVKVSIAKVRFHGTIRLSDVVPAEQYVLNGEGRGIAGAATGRAYVHLSDADGGTQLAYRAEAAAGGKLAEFGQAWIEKAGRKLAERFFQSFQARIEEGKV